VRKRSIKLGLPAAQKLARLLLKKWPKLVNETVLYSLVIYSIGCVIPTQLDREQTPTNFPPVWVTSMINPQFGPLPPQTKGESIELSLFATDSNLTDTLVARAFLLGSDNTYQLRNTEAQLMLGTPTGDPQRDAIRSGRFESFDYCDSLPNGTYFLYAFVADRNFVGNTNIVNGGLSDSNHWELTCP
jgi:hypothetical protein